MLAHMQERMTITNGLALMHSSFLMRIALWTSLAASVAKSIAKTTPTALKFS